VREEERKRERKREEGDTDRSIVGFDSE